MVLPPLKMIQDYSGSTSENDYLAIGRDHVERMQPYFNGGDNILEIGCGCGRMAQALPAVWYHGWDVAREPIDWCQRITEDRPTFRFFHLDLYNSQYNKTGRPLGRFGFPYPSEWFDFIFLTSVFTHTAPEVVRHYMGEVKRLLKPGKTCVATFFIIENGTHPRFDWTWHPMGERWVVHPENPDSIVGYEEGFIRGLMPAEDVWYGPGQDWVIFRK